MGLLIRGINRMKRSQGDRTDILPLSTSGIVPIVSLVKRHVPNAMSWLCAPCCSRGSAVAPGNGKKPSRNLCAWFLLNENSPLQPTLEACSSPPEPSSSLWGEQGITLLRRELHCLEWARLQPCSRCSKKDRDFSR